MSNQLLSLVALVAGSCLFLVIGIHRALTGGDREISSRLKKMESQAGRQDRSEPRHDTASFRLLASVSRTAVKVSLFNRLARTVDKNLAGADIPLKSEEYIVLTAGAAVLAGAVFTLLSMEAYYGALSAGFTVVLSAFWVKAAKTRRLSRFNSQIGDALVIMANALRSGFSFLQAMDMVRKELPSPISREFGRTFQEMSLGTPTEEALENLNSRVGSEDLELIVTAVLIQRQTGGNLAEILDNIAGTIRERVRIKGEIKTLTAQGRISGIIIGVMPIAVAAIISVISPDYIKPLVTSPLGRTLLLWAMVLELAGIILIRRVIDIKY